MTEPKTLLPSLTNLHMRRLGQLRDAYEHIAQPLPPGYRAKLENLAEPFETSIPEFQRARELWTELQHGLTKLEAPVAAQFRAIIGDLGQAQHHQV